MKFIFRNGVTNLLLNYDILIEQLIYIPRKCLINDDTDQNTTRQQFDAGIFSITNIVRTNFTRAIRYTGRNFFSSEFIYATTNDGSI